jgi:hypothetical protein
MTQIMQDINNENYRDLKELCYDKKIWRVVTNTYGFTDL